MKYFIIILMLSLTSCNIDQMIIDEFKPAFKMAYFQGQKDAINGDIKINLNSDSVYYWLKSP